MMKQDVLLIYHVICFAQEPEKRSFTLGTPSSPYDATRNGPLCPSAGRTAEDADRIRDTNITEAVANLAESALVCLGTMYK